MGISTHTIELLCLETISYVEAEKILTHGLAAAFRLIGPDAMTAAGWSRKKIIVTTASTALTLCVASYSGIPVSLTQLIAKKVMAAAGLNLLGLGKLLLDSKLTGMSSEELDPIKKVTFGMGSLFSFASGILSGGIGDGFSSLITSAFIAEAEVLKLSKEDFNGSGESQDL